MDVLFGFEHEETFIKIGDEIMVIYSDGTHRDGILSDIRVQDNEVIVDDIVISLVDVESVSLLN